MHDCYVNYMMRQVLVFILSLIVIDMPYDMLIDMRQVLMVYAIAMLICVFTLVVDFDVFDDPLSGHDEEVVSPFPKWGCGVSLPRD